ncbi:MAG: hypothetical protein V3U73_12450 [bacterium]
MKRSLMFLLCSCIFFGNLHAQTSKGKFGISVGQWQPNQLSTDEIGSVFSGTADSTPFYAVHYSRHLFGDIALHLSIGYWAHFFDRPDKPITVRVTPIEIGVEQSLISDSNISPYVAYGVAALLTSTVDGNRLYKLTPGNASKVGFEIYLIAGIQADIFRPIGVELNFGYVVANLPESLGVGKDYSGIRATFGLVYSY